MKVLYLPEKPTKRQVRSYYFWQYTGRMSRHDARWAAKESTRIYFKVLNDQLMITKGYLEE